MLTTVFSRVFKAIGMLLMVMLTLSAVPCAAMPCTSLPSHRVAAGTMPGMTCEKPCCPANKPSGPDRQHHHQAPQTVCSMERSAATAAVAPQQAGHAPVFATVLLLHGDVLSDTPECLRKGSALCRSARLSAYSPLRI